VAAQNQDCRGRSQRPHQRRRRHADHVLQGERCPISSGLGRGSTDLNHSVRSATFAHYYKPTIHNRRTGGAADNTGRTGTYASSDNTTHCADNFGNTRNSAACTDDFDASNYPADNTTTSADVDSSSERCV
jgi:hypothetical protein